MMAHPVAQYLVNFGVVDGGALRGEVSGGNDAPDRQEVPAHDDAGRTVLAAREEAFVEGLAAAGREFEALLAKEREEFAMRLAAERETCIRQEAEKLSDKIKAALDMAEASIAASVARILRPFVDDAVRRKAVDELVEHVAALFRGRERPCIEIRGPEDLLAALQERLPPSTAAIEYLPDDSIDVRVAAGETMIESQLALWIARIRP